MVLATLLLLAVSSRGQQTFTLKGLVTDDEGKALELATVSCVEQGKMTMTNLKGEYRLTLHTADSVVVFYNYTLQPAGTAYDTAEACGSYQWHGNTYTASATYADTVPLASGCDSLFLLTLTVHPVSETFDTVYACEHYEWNGTDYTSSTDFTNPMTDIYGCDSIVQLHLNIHNTLYGTVFDTTYDGNYIWNDSVYTHSGIYKQYFTTIYGCDSIVTLILTVYGNTEGIIGMDDEPVRVFPSPTSGVVNFSEKIDQVEVFDMTGRLLGHYVNVRSIDLSALPKGTYPLKLVTPRDHTICRVILK